MEHTELTTLSEIADDFFLTAQKVNDASVERKLHTEHALEAIEDAEAAIGTLLRELKVVGRESLLLRNRHDAVLNISRILSMNVANQLVILDYFKTRDRSGEETNINPLYIDEVGRLGKNLKASLVKAVAYLEEIVRISNEMILMDNVIQLSKNGQKKRVAELKQLALTALGDAEKAIAGSDQNSKNGELFIEEMEKIPHYVEEESLEGLQSIFEKVNLSEEIAENVNRNSKSQFEFAEEVLTKTNHLVEESRHIKELVSKKHQLFNQNLELIAEVAVLVAVEFFEFLSVKDLIPHFFDRVHSFDAKTLEKVYDLAAYVENCCSEVESVASLNYDMTEAISHNTKIEERSVELTRSETECFEKIKNHVHLMTEKTRFPVDGSAQNIENARKVQRLLRQMIGRIEK